MKKNTTFFIAMLLAYSAHAQHTSTQYLYWLRYQNQVNFSPSLYWNNEADNRRFFDPDVENQLIFHSRLHYKKKKWDFAGGLTYSLAFAQKPEDGYQYANSEIRPVAEASVEQPVGKVFLQGRVRVDNRFIQTSDEKSVFETSRYVLRHRYRAQVRIPIKTKENVTTIGLRIADEIMFNSKENTFDQNRIYLTSDFLLSKRFSLEAGYIYIYQQRFAHEEFFSRHVARFSILHKVIWY